MNIKTTLLMLTLFLAVGVSAPAALTIKNLIFKHVAEHKELLKYEVSDYQEDELEGDQQ